MTRTMFTLQKIISDGRAQCDALEAIIAAEPEFAKWHTGDDHLPLTRMIQLFPGRDIAQHAEQSAIKIARAFGGSWSRCHHGRWIGRSDKWTVILHNVFEPVSNPNRIDLSTPAPSTAAV